MDIKYSDRVRSVMRRALVEARLQKCDFIGAEHFLLAMINEGVGIGFIVLNRLHVDLEKAKSQIEKVGDEPLTENVSRDLPMALEADRVVELAMEESKVAEEYLVNSGHLLIGIVRESVSRAAAILKEQGVILEAVRKEMATATENGEIEFAKDESGYSLESIAEAERLFRQIKDLPMDVRHHLIHKLVMHSAEVDDKGCLEDYGFEVKNLFWINLMDSLYRFVPFVRRGRGA